MTLLEIRIADVFKDSLDKAISDTITLLIDLLKQPNVFIPILVIIGISILSRIVVKKRRR